MDFTSFNIENLQLKYADTLARIGNQPLFESVQSEIEYHKQNSLWLLESENTYVHDTGKGTLMFYGGGNISFIDKALLEANINEADSVWTKIWEVIKSLASTGWETITHTIHNIGSISDGDIAGISLAFGGICELLAIITVLWPPLHPLNVTLTVLAGLGLIIGGISQCFKAGSSLGTLKHQAEKVHESSDSNDPIDVFSDGTQHIMMGVAGVALSSLGVFGGKGVKQTAQKVYQSTVKVGMKKSFSVILKAMAKKQTELKISNLGIKAILKHESKHFFLHYVAAVIAFFLGSNLTKKSDGKSSWLDLFRGLESTINSKTAAVTNTVSKAKKGIEGTIGGHVDMLDNTVNSLFSGIEGIIGLLGTVLGTIVGKLGDLVELIEAFAELFRENTTDAAYETVYSAGKKEATATKKNIVQKMQPYKDISISNDSKDFMGSDGFVKMGRSSTSVNKNYKQPVSKVNVGKNGFPAKLENFPSFDDFTKQNLNENVMNDKRTNYVKLYEEFTDMKEVEELHEGFVSRGINIAKEGIQEIKAFFNGLELSLWDKVGKFTKKDLIDIAKGITENVSKHADSNLLDQLTNAEDLIIDQINSGKIKTGKQIGLVWQDAMDIYIIK